MYTEEDRAAGEPEKDVAIVLRDGARVMEHWCVRKDGSRAYCVDALRLMSDHSGDGKRILKVARDMTEGRCNEEALRQSEARLARAKDELEQRVRERTAQLTETINQLEGFSYSLSHDMRAPLRAMNSFAEILQREFAERLGPEGAELLGRISAAAARLDELIRDVLTYHRLGSAEPDLVPVDPRQS